MSIPLYHNSLKTNNYKGHMAKPRGVGSGEDDGDGWGGEGVVGEKGRKLYLNNNKIKINKKLKRFMFFKKSLVLWLLWVRGLSARQ